MQIDYILIRRQHFTTVTDCEVVPYETIAPQHRPLIAVLRIKPLIKQREERTGPPRIKWWRFGEKKEETVSLIRLPTITNVEESWNQMKDTIHKAGGGTQHCGSVNSLTGLFRKEEHHLNGKKVPVFQYEKRKVIQQNVQITVRSGYFPIL